MRLTGTERELRAENQSPPIFRPQNTLGDGANGLPLAVCTTTAHTCHTSHTHPSRWTPNPVPATKGVPAGLVQATFIIENLDPGNNDTPTPPTPKLRLARNLGTIGDLNTMRIRCCGERIHRADASRRMTSDACSWSRIRGADVSNSVVTAPSLLLADGRR